MKKITRLLFMCLLIPFLGVQGHAQFVAPDGDGGQPLLELYVYGATLPGGFTAEAGDQIAVFSGGTLCGVLTLTVEPSLEDWTNCHLIAYSKDTDDNDLYTPGSRFLLQYYDDSETDYYYAWTWGDGNDIDFHNQWYAPTSDNAGTATTYGAYFPAEGAYSYAYVGLTFSTTAPTLEATIDIDVFENDGTTAVPLATITSDGYSSASVANTYSLAVFAGDATDTDEYNYTITVAAAGFTTETFDITVTGAGGPYSQTVYMDGSGDLDGHVSAYNLTTGLYDYVANAIVSATIDGILYTATTDATGYFLISDIPDGTWTFDVVYPGYVDGSLTAAINYDGTTTNAADVELDMEQGTITGNIFDATTISLITGSVTVKTLDENDVVVSSVVTATGTYTLDEYPGTYKLMASCIGYDDFVIEEHTFYPNHIDELNFNLLPTGTTAHFDPITGNPLQMWTIHIEMAKFGVNSLLPWDELVIFDTDVAGLVDEPGLRVGTIQLQQPGVWQNAPVNALKAYAQFSNGDPGFVAGDAIEIWAYDISHDAVYETPLDWWFNEGVGTYHGTTFPDLTTYPFAVSYLNIYWETVPGQLTGTLVDDVSSLAISGATVDVLNRYTQEVVVSGTTNGSGVYTLPMDEGTYDVRFSMTGYFSETTTEVLVEQSAQTDLGETRLTPQIPVTLDYSFADNGFYFVGRPIGAATVDMLTTLDNNGDPAAFSTYTSSEVADDAAIRLYYDTDHWVNDPYDWELSKGYFLNLEAAYDFDMNGTLIKPELNPITLTVGTHYVPYYPYSGVDFDDAITAFATILDDIEWVMDEEGNRLQQFSGNWVDNIGTLDPTKGYIVFVNVETTLTYPAQATKSHSSAKAKSAPEHFVFRGGNAAAWTYTLFIDTDEFEAGDEIAAFSNGQLVGSMVIESDNAWDNDLNTFNNTIEGGYAVGTPIELMAWDASEGKEYTVGMQMIAIDDICYIGVNYPAGLDHYSYVSVTRGIVGVQDQQISTQATVYPNPTTGMVTIHANEVIDQVVVYTLHGARVAAWTPETSSTQYDLSNLPSGSYMLNISTTSGSLTKRLIVY